MSKKQRLIFLLGAAVYILAAAGIGLTMAYFMNREEAVSADSLEQVRFGLCMLDSEEEYKDSCLTGLLPGQAVERKPAVIVDKDSPEAYIRVRVSFGGVLKEPKEESREARTERLKRIRELRGGIRFCDGWLEGEDGCYYYQKKAASGSMVPIYDRVVIPENWDNNIAEQTFTIELHAEAVRADCLEPWIETKGGTIEGWE